MGVLRGTQPPNLFEGNPKHFLGAPQAPGESANQNTNLDSFCFYRDKLFCFYVCICKATPNRCAWFETATKRHNQDCPNSSPKRRCHGVFLRVFLWRETRSKPQLCLFFGLSLSGVLFWVPFKMRDLQNDEFAIHVVSLRPPKEVPHTSEARHVRRQPGSGLEGAVAFVIQLLLPSYGLLVGTVAGKKWRLGDPGGCKVKGPKWQRLTISLGVPSN